MKVRCIDNDGGFLSLTIGKVYKVKNHSIDCYETTNDFGNKTKVFKTRFEEVKEPSISLKLEGIEEGEKFNVITKNGNVHVNSPHYVKDNAVYNCFGRAQKETLHEILGGILSIKKINPKQEKIDRIKNEMRRLADELEELEQ